MAVTAIILPIPPDIIIIPIPVMRGASPMRLRLEAQFADSFLLAGRTAIKIAKRSAMKR